MLKSGFIFFIFILSGLNALAQQPEFSRAFQFGNPSFYEGNSKIVKTQNGFLVGGEFLESATFGQETIISNGESDVFLVHFDEAANAINLNNWGSEGSEYFEAMQTDQAGNILLVISFTGELSMFGSTYISQGGNDLILLKLSPEQELLWSKHYGSLTTDYLSALDLDSDGNIFLFGTFYEELFIENEVLTSNGSSDIYLLKFFADGTLDYAVNEGNDGFEQASDMKVMEDGTVYFSATFYDETELAGNELTTDNETGVYLASFDPTYQLSWYEIINGDKLASNVKLATSGNGNILISGEFSLTLKFDGATFYTNEFDPDVYLAKFSETGEFLWGRQGDGKSSDQVYDIQTDQFENIYLTGSFLDTITFDGLTLNYTLCCGSLETFVVSYDSDGNIQWGRQISGIRSNVNDTYCDESGNLFIAGMFNDIITMGNLEMNAHTEFRNFFCELEGVVANLDDHLTTTDPFYVYPNPGNGNLYIEKATKYAGQLQIFNQFGTMLETKILDPALPTEYIDLNNLPNGTYILRFIENGKQDYQSQIIISR